MKTARRDPEALAEGDRILARIDSHADAALQLARWMSEHPELSLEEHATSRRYRDSLAERAFRIEETAGAMETAFVATRGSESAPLHVGLLAEMDALPEIGHACGHNLSGPASLLAAWALVDVVSEEDLLLSVVGCPAEETGVGKRALVAAGVFESMDVAMMAHASDMRRAHRLFLGNEKFDLIYRGRAAHAAAYPERGINALDGAVACYVALGLLRQQLPSGVRVHAIISDGGAAPNVIPERAILRIWVRALDPSALGDAVDRVQACARGAATSTGTELEIATLGGSSPPMRPNLALASLYRSQLDRLGLAETSHAPGENIGSSDITHISRVIPTIHPNFPIGRDLQLHTRAFAEATISAQGESGLLEAARALALTTLELVRHSEHRESVRRDWESTAPAAPAAD